MFKYASDRFRTRQPYDIDRTIVQTINEIEVTKAYPLLYQRWADQIPGPPRYDKYRALDSLVFALVIIQITLHDDFLVYSSNLGNAQIMESDLPLLYNKNKMFLDGKISNIQLRKEYLQIWLDIQKQERRRM